MLADIHRLSIVERIQLVEDIWDSIAAPPDALPLTDAQRQELDRRLDAKQPSPQERITWPELKVTLSNR